MPRVRPRSVWVLSHVVPLGSRAYIFPFFSISSLWVNMLKMQLLGQQISWFSPTTLQLLPSSPTQAAPVAEARTGSPKESDREV